MFGDDSAVDSPDESGRTLISRRAVLLSGTAAALTGGLGVSTGEAAADHCHQLYGEGGYGGFVYGGYMPDQCGST